jgi:hypothetical protein
MIWTRVVMVYGACGDIANFKLILQANVSLAYISTLSALEVEMIHPLIASSSLCHTARHV